MKAKDIMTSRVVSVEADTPILQAVRIMLQRRVSGLPVVDNDGHLVGIITEGDFLRRDPLFHQLILNVVIYVE